MRYIHLLPLIAAAAIHPQISGSTTLVGHVAAELLVPIPHKMKHAHGVPILQSELLPEERLFWEKYSTETYFSTPLNHRMALYVHIAAYLASYVFVYPLVLVFWNTGHFLYLPALSAHVALVVVAAANLWVFEGSIRDLYPHNAFSTMTVLLFIASLVHWGVAVLATAYRYFDSEFSYYELDSEDDCARGSMESPELTLQESNSRDESFELDDLDADSHSKTSTGAMLHRPLRLAFLLQVPALKKATLLFGKTAFACAGVLNWALFAFFFIYFPTGIATYLVYGNGPTKFNLLAHFIKGGVFFVLGLVTLSRYCGAFKGKGWAWNHRFVKASAATSGWLKWQGSGLWTMELVESSLILFYGSTNIFLEHLSNAGGEWSAKDLQHLSIAFIFIGCGLCGVLLESKLSTWRYQKAMDNLSAVATTKQSSSVKKATPGYSLNPFPVLTIYWTGILMSLHQQASELSTAIHTQWGGLFVLACVFRTVTYLYISLAPANTRALKKPSYPMTELVVAFGLLAGGLIFMESCDPVIYSLEYYGLTAMFTLNVSLGVVALIMAWVMSVFSIKDAMVSRMSGRRY